MEEAKPKEETHVGAGKKLFGKRSSRSQRERNSKREAFDKFSSDIPLCAERLFLELLYHFEFQKTRKNDQPLLETSEEIATQGENLLRADHLYADSDAKRILPELLTAIRENSPDDALRAIDEIDALLDSVETSKKFAHVIKDKEVVLLLGVSGAGKSTTIQFLAGSVVHGWFKTY